MIAGHGRRHVDGLAVLGDTWLGIVWQLFAWTVIGSAAGLVLLLAGVADPLRARVVALGVLAVVLVLCSVGPPIRHAGCPGCAAPRSPSIGWEPGSTERASC